MSVTVISRKNGIVEVPIYIKQGIWDMFFKMHPQASETHINFLIV